MAYRVVQWATGAMGRTCLRAILDHPELELVGLYVYSDQKAGRDAGEIARRPPVGVIATRDVDEILALDADVVVHAARLAPPYGAHDADIRRLLASGKNVISINGYSFPRRWPRERLGAMEAACASGSASLMGAGLNPGFVAEKIAVAATSICTRVEAISVQEVVDCRQMRNPDYVFGVLGFGADPAIVNPNDPEWPPAAALNGMYEEVVAAVADRLGLRLDSVVTDHSVEPARADVVVGAGEIAAGRVGRLNWVWRGQAEGRTITMAIAWTMAPAEPAGPLWQVTVEGSPGVRITIDLTPPNDAVERTSPEQLGLAGAVINAIPAVCAAPPGVIAAPLATPFHAGVCR
jgi:2,4-diaminopentanoate dehydrogenase